MPHPLWEALALKFHHTEAMFSTVLTAKWQKCRRKIKHISTTIRRKSFHGCSWHGRTGLCQQLQDFRSQVTQSGQITSHPPFTQKSLFTEKFLHTEAFCTTTLYTGKLLHTETFTHRSFLHREVLHRGAFTHRRVYTEKRLHRGVFAHRRLLRTEPFAQSSFYPAKSSTEKLLGTDTFTQRSLCRGALAHRIL